MSECDEHSFVRHERGLISASLFGRFELRSPDGTEIVISNRRVRALLAMLCLVPNEPIERDYLSRLLWPGRFEAHAKASLRQCLLELGKSFGSEGQAIVEVTRSRVSLHPGAIRTDLGELERALQAGDYDTAAKRLAAIGTAPMLENMEFGEAFADWLSRHRTKAEHNLQAAIAAGLAALKSAGHHELHGRLQTSWQLRNPSQPGITASDRAAGRTPIAVLPFRSASLSGDQDYFTDGMVDELITALSGVAGLQLAGRTSSFHFRDSTMTPAQIAAELGVSHLVEGSVQRQGEKVRIHVHLLDGTNGFELWGSRFDGALDDIFELQEAVARGVTEALAGALGITLQPPVVGNLTHSKEAYDLYLQGRALNARLFGDGVLTRAAELIEQAIALDPGFAEAWVLLGDVNQRMGIYLAGTDQTEASAKMADCVRKALAVKPGLGHAYGLLALHEFTRNNIVGSLDLAFKGYEVEPSNPAVAVRIGGLLLFCGLTRRGMEFLDQAIDQDPVDGRNYMVRSAGQLNLGDVGAAIADAQRCVDLGFPSIWLGVALTAAGEHQRAVEAYQQTRYAIANSIPPPSGTGPMPPAMIDAYWDVAARGVCSGKPEDRAAYCRTLDFLHLSMQDKEHQAITLPAVFMGYADMLFKTIGTRITLQNLACLMSIWSEIDPMCQIWQHEEFIPFAQRIGMVEAWDKYGWPDLLPPPTNRLQGAD
jgi:TolB-like protein